MVTSQGYLEKLKHFLNQLIEPDQLEAPNREFVGHRDILTRSLARYHYIAPQVKGAVLEIGCGRGYGSEIFRGRADKFIGVDLSMDFLSEAKDLLPKSQFIQSNGSALPFNENSFDTIISLEVIEHLKDDNGFLRTIAGLVKEDGIFAISTPNRVVSSGNSSKPMNRFHCREYTAQEFFDLLSVYFKKVKLLGQFDAYSSVTPGNWILDHISIDLKYLLPAKLQGILSSVIRKPILLEECLFASDNLNSAHTFLALCT